MKFFVPAAKDDVQAESAYEAFAKFNNVSMPKKRVWKLQWRHGGKQLSCEIGKPIVEGFRLAGDEPVLAVFPWSNAYILIFTKVLAHDIIVLR
jgi:hypothetical protein